MAKLTSPSISITFAEKAASLIERGSRGIVALVLKDASAKSDPEVYTIRDVTDIPAGWADVNKRYVKDCLKGYSKSPLKIIAYIMPTTGETDRYTDMLAHLETETFQWLAIPTVETDSKTADVVAWVKKQRENDIMIKAVLPNADAADCEGIINWASTLSYEEVVSGSGDDVTVTTKTYTAEQGTPRIAGILAGTDATISATYAPMMDFSDTSRLSKSDRDTAVGAGKLIALWDGEKVKLDRAVTSFVTTTGNKGESFKKIKLVEDMDMIKTDIQSTIQDDYIGKFANSYDNKCLLITAINGYFKTLVSEGVIESGTAEIDIASQRIYLESLGKEVTVNGTTKKPADLSDDEVKIASTGSHVFLKATVVLLDAIEDVNLTINV
jgi:hypothetical protein|nr:MAG TPA: tail protein [Caudoviricetes sp.]